MPAKRMSLSNKLLERVWQTIKRFRLLEPRESVLVGVSGGPDSVAILLLLRAISDKYHQGWRLKVAHLNHLIRAREADQDEVFVRNLARRLGLKVYTERINIPALSKMSGSVEETARNERYQFLKRVAKKYNIKKVAVGHILDDQAETVLLRILRGCGLRGLRGILPKRPILSGSNITLIRPILEIERKEVGEFLKEQHQPYRLDSSNLDNSYLRNRVRRKLLPYLARYNKGIKHNLVQLARTGQETYDFLETETERTLKPLSLSRNGSTLSVSLLKKLHPALQIALLGKVLKKARTCLVTKRVSRDLPDRQADGRQESLAGITSAHYQAILSLLTRSGRSRAIHLPGNLVVSRTYDNLRFGLKVNKVRGKKITPVKVTVPGKKRIPKYGLIVTSQILQKSSLFLSRFKKTNPIRGKVSNGAKTSWEEVFDLDKITQPLTIRYRKQGDKFQPLGMKASQSLKNFFINLKIPQSERDTIPLLVANNQIVWVIGHRIGERVKLTPGTKRILRVRIT